MRSIKIFVVLLFFGFISVTQTFAQIRINEVLANPSGPSNEPDEFIELINSGEEQLDISGWVLSDTQGSITVFIIPNNTIIEKGSFLTFRRSQTGISLNNGGDGVVVKASQESDENIDSISFGSSEENISYGLYPDGDKEHAGNMQPTENLPNSPLIIPTPTQTPVPTKTPIPTKTMTPTKVPTNTSTPPVSKIDKEDDDKTEPDVLSVKSVDDKASRQSSVKRIENEVYDDKVFAGEDTDSKNKESKILESSDSRSGSIAVIGGSILLLISCGILLFQKYKYIFLR